MVASDESTEPAAAANHTANIVPDVLLSLAKDGRYLEQCRSLLSQLLLPHESLHQQGASLAAASVLYTLLVLLRQGKSLGQEAAGLKYSSDKWKIVLGSLMASTGAYILRRLAHSAVDNIDTINNANETLRGNQRRLIYQQQRQRMLGQATDATNNHVNLSQGMSDEPLAVERQAETSPSSQTLDQLRRMLQNLVVELVPGLSSGTSDGPHSTETASNNLSIGAWIMRLHLAWYLIDGKYPTWMHRLFRLHIQENESTLTHRPTTARLVGMLMVLQALGSLVPNLGSRLVMLVAQHISVATPEPPAILFYSNHSQSVPPGSTPGRSCVICRQPRLHPACSVKCGHVMCWSCLQQWVHEHKSCPICRMACLPQDVLALQAYTDSPDDDGGHVATG